MLSIILLAVIVLLAYKVSPKEKKEHAHVHGAGQVGLLAALALFVIGLANFIFGALYMYSLGIFTEGGGSYTASMRYLAPTLSLIVAVTLLEDYVFSFVVSALSGADEML